MSKFIKIRNRIINLDKVYDFQLIDHAIFVFYSANEEDYALIEFASRQEAKFAFENIPHLIDGAYVPGWVREENQRANVAYDSDWEELPF